MNLITKIKEYFDLPIQTVDEKNNFIGCTLMKLGMGGFMAWTQFSVYFFSYFYSKDNDVNIALANSLIQAGIIPISILVMFSVKIAQKITYKKLIRICSIIYPIGIILQGLTQNIYQFLFTTLVLVMTPFGLLSLPIFNCLISYFPKNIGKVTGLLLFVFGISQFIFQLAAFYMINPKNKKATIQYYYHDNQDEAAQEEHKSILLFDEEIANNIMPSLVSLGLVCGILTIYGGFKVKNKYEEENQIQIENQRQNQNRISIELQNMEVSTIQLQDVQEKKSLTQELLNYEPNLTILQAIFKEPFLIISYITLLITIYLMFLSTNFKTYLLQKVNDDKFLTYMGSFCNLIGSFSNILWGAAVDKYPLKYIYLSMTTVFCIIAILFPILAYNRFALTFIYFGLHVIQQGALAMTLPAIIQFYGHKLGAQLVPFKLISLFLSCLILPLLSYYSVKTGNFDMVFFILGILEISSILVVLKMKARYRYD